MAPLPKLAEPVSPTPLQKMTDEQAAIYAGDLLLELRNMTSMHPRLRFLTYLLEMAFQEAFTQQARFEQKN